MIDHFNKTFQLIKFNWKTLLIFETLYRLFGLAFIFPLAERLFYFSVQLTGKEYITNSNFIEYITKPTTLILGFIFFVIFGFYVAYEVVVLSLLFHNNLYDNKIGIQTLLIASMKKFRQTITRYNLVIVLSSMIFLFLVEALQLVGIASTVKLPLSIVEEFSKISNIYVFIGIAVVILIILFIETIFFELQCTVEMTSIKENFIQSRKILKKSRFQIIIEFLIVNILLNLIFYLLYLIIILLVGLFLNIFKDSDFVYPYILTILYTTYLIIGFIATIVLIPINFAWINVLYYEKTEEKDRVLLKETKYIMKNKIFTNKVFNRIITAVLFVLAITTIFFLSTASDNPSRLELFNNPSVIIHRGGGIYGPENTLSAIQAGIDSGADAIEFDVRFTSDGIPVLMHDETITRTTNATSNIKVADLTLEQLKEYDAGSYFGEEFIGETVPTLFEALDLINNNANVYIEIKGYHEDAASLISAVIDEVGFNNEIKFISFNETLLEEMKLYNEDAETVLLLGSFFGDIEVLASKDYINHYGFQYQVVEARGEYIQALQQSGKGVVVWTVNDEINITQMNSLGVDGIITDNPLLAREIIYSSMTKSTYNQLLERLFTREDPAT